MTTSSHRADALQLAAVLADRTAAYLEDIAHIATHHSLDIHDALLIARFAVARIITHLPRPDSS